MPEASVPIDFPDLDPLRLVYLLVLDGQGPPDLLTHLAPSGVRMAMQAFLVNTPFSQFLEHGRIRIQDVLFEKYPDIHPHPLWRAWMENTQSAAIERLRADLLGNIPS